MPPPNPRTRSFLSVPAPNSPNFWFSAKEFEAPADGAKKTGMPLYTGRSLLPRPPRVEPLSIQIHPHQEPRITHTVSNQLVSHTAASGRIHSRRQVTPLRGTPRRTLAVSHRGSPTRTRSANPLQNRFQNQ